MIPKRLQREEFRFIRIKAREKIPFEKNWQKESNYKYDDVRLLNWIDKGGNYGIMGGFGNLIILDFDEEQIEKEKGKLLPKTFTVKTGTGRLHKYFLCDECKSFKILDEDKNTLVDIQGKGKQVIAPGSIHPNGNRYEVFEDNEIAKISLRSLQILFADYLKDKDKLTKDSGHSDILANRIKEQISIIDLMKQYNYDLSRNPTMCKLGHESKGESCFSYSESQNLWYCFHCDRGGDVFNFIMEHEKIDFLNAKQIFMEKLGIKEIPSMFTIDDYYNNVLKFWEVQPFFYDKSCLFWIWNSKLCKWDLIDEIDIMNEIDKQLNFYGQTIKHNIKNNYLESFKRVGRLKIPKEPNKNWIQFEDNIYDLKTNKIFKSTPKYFICNPIPWKIAEKSDTSHMDKLFQQWVGVKNVQTLYEIVAYCCVTDYPIHLIFCFIGSGRNGKSTFLRLLNRFIGKNNISSTELDILMDSRFESTKLYKKLICTLGETNFGVLSKTSLIKRLTGGDMIGFEFKNKQPFDDYNYAKIIISSNSLPTSNDTSEGFYRRWLIMDFPNKFPEGKDILDDIPEKEYNRLAAKVLKILPNLIRGGKFTNQGSIEERKRRYIEASNPLSIFIEKECKRKWEANILFDRLYNAYKKYLIKNDKRVVNRKEFISGLEQEGLFSRRAMIDDIRGQWIDGVQLKEYLSDF